MKKKKILETIHSLLDKADIANFAAKVNVVVDAKKNKTEERIIVIGKLRLYDITHKGKVKINFSSLFIF